MWSNKVTKIVPQMGPGSPFWVPRGRGLDLPFGSLWVLCGSTVPLGLIVGGFWCSLGGHLEPQIYEMFVCIFDVFSGCFLEGWLFWLTCWCQGDDQKGKGRFVKMLVFVR